MSLFPDFFYQVFFLFFFFATEYLIYQNLFLCSLAESPLILFLSVSSGCPKLLPAAPPLNKPWREEGMFLRGIFPYSENGDFPIHSSSSSVWGRRLSGEDGVIVITQ